MGLKPKEVRCWCQKFHVFYLTVKEGGKKVVEVAEVVKGSGGRKWQKEVAEGRKLQKKGSGERK